MLNLSRPVVSSESGHLANSRTLTAKIITKPHNLKKKKKKSVTVEHNKDD